MSDKSILIGLSPIWLIGLALALGIVADVLIPVTVAETVKTSDWIGFAGSVIAGAMTLFAGVLAWLSVQRTFAREDGRQQLEWASAKFAAKVVLTQPIHAAAAAMNVTKRYLEAMADEPEDFPPDAVGLVEFRGPNRKALAIKPDLDRVMNQLRAIMTHFAVAEAWKGLNAEDRANYFVVTSTLHSLTSIYSDPPTIPFLQLIANQHDLLSQFETYIRAFDSELADVFARDSRLGRADIIIER